MRGSRFFKRLRRALLAALLLALLAAGGLYLAASWVPSRYRPPDLTAQERKREAHYFWETASSDFHNKAQVRAPFSVSLSADQINRYLASMDEIAALYPGPSASPGEVRSRLERSGLSEPAVAIGEGVLTIMVRLTEYGKVLSADLSFEFQPDGRLRVRLREVRLGRLTVPEFLFRRRLRGLRERLLAAVRPAPGGGESRSAVSAEDVSALVSGLVSAIDEEPVSTDLRKFRQRIVAVELHEGQLTLRMQPMTAPAPGR